MSTNSRSNGVPPPPLVPLEGATRQGSYASVAAAAFGHVSHTQSSQVQPQAPSQASPQLAVHVPSQVPPQQQVPPQGQVPQHTQVPPQVPPQGPIPPLQTVPRSNKSRRDSLPSSQLSGVVSPWEFRVGELEKGFKTLSQSSAFVSSSVNNLSTAVERLSAHVEQVLAQNAAPQPTRHVEEEKKMDSTGPADNHRVALELQQLLNLQSSGEAFPASANNASTDTLLATLGAVAGDREVALSEAYERKVKRTVRNLTAFRAFSIEGVFPRWLQLADRWESASKADKSIWAAPTASHQKFMLQSDNVYEYFLSIIFMLIEDRSNVVAHSNVVSKPDVQASLALVLQLIKVSAHLPILLQRYTPRSILDCLHSHVSRCLTHSSDVSSNLSNATLFMEPLAPPGLTKPSNLFLLNVGKKRNQMEAGVRKGGRPAKRLRVDARLSLVSKLKTGYCFAFNLNEACSGACGFIHACGYPGCGKPHPAIENHC